MPGVDKKWLPDPYTIIIALILLLIYQHMKAVDVASKGARPGTLVLPNDVTNQTTAKREEGERGGDASLLSQFKSSTQGLHNGSGGVWNATALIRNQNLEGTGAANHTGKTIPEMTNEKSAHQKVEEEMKRRERDRLLDEQRKEIERKYAEEKKLAEEKARAERKRLAAEKAAEKKRLKEEKAAQAAAQAAAEAAAAAALANSKPNQQTQQVFEGVYQSFVWGREGRGSGHGSSIDATSSIRASLERLIHQYNITSMLDVPCGGMLWMPHVVRSVRKSKPSFRYHGVDIVRNLIDSHRVEFQGEGSAFKFDVVDFSSQPLPRGYDLVFSRDALQHLPLHHTFVFLDAVRASGAKYLLVGSYVTEHDNHEISVGGYYSINLLDAPFKISAPIEIVAEASTPHGDPKKHMLLLNVQTMTWEKEH